MQTFIYSWTPATRILENNERFEEMAVSAFATARQT